MNLSYEDAILHFEIQLLERQHNMLKNKEEQLNELFSLCKDVSSAQMLYDMLLNFSEMDDDIYNIALLDIAEKIISQGYSDSTIGLLALTIDRKPDSSQSIVQDLKVQLALKDYGGVEIRNTFNSRHELIITKKRLHIILVDEFIGSGKTCRNRFMTIKNEFRNIAGLTK